MDAERTAHELFGLLSSEIRVEILSAIAIAQNEEMAVGGGMSPQSFTDIYEQVDVDNTAKFSYHLGELVGTFLHKDDSGYSLTHAGDRMTRFILAENFREPADFGEIPADGVCLFCGTEALAAILKEQFLLIRCGECGKPATGYIIVPALTRGFEGDQLLSAYAKVQAAEYTLAQQGICPACSGAIDGAVISAEELPLPDSVPASHFVLQECKQCLRGFSGPLTHSVAYRPASVAFHWDHGVDITATGMWEFHEHLRSGEWSSESLDTPEDTYRVELRYGSELLRVDVDADARVTHTERVSARKPG